MINYQKFLKSTPNKLLPKLGDIWEYNGVYISAVLILQTYTANALVYFVSGSNGDEFGQFPTYEKALIRAREMSLLPEKERKRYDQ